MSKPSNVHFQVPCVLGGSVIFKYSMEPVWVIFIHRQRGIKVQRSDSPRSDGLIFLGVDAVAIHRVHCIFESANSWRLLVFMMTTTLSLRSSGTRSYSRVLVSGINSLVDQPPYRWQIGPWSQSWLRWSDFRFVSRSWPDLDGLTEDHIVSQWWRQLRAQAKLKKKDWIHLEYCRRHRHPFRYQWHDPLL